MKAIKKIITMSIIFSMLCMTLCACGSKSIVVDYADAASFEAALNAGENLEGKTLIFEALELHPDSAAGYNVWAGEHLNFISSRNPDIKAGDQVAVKATVIESNMGSWFIQYEKIDGVVGDTSIKSNGSSPVVDAADVNGADSNSANLGIENNDSSSDGNGTASFSVENTSSEKPLELVDYGWFINDPSSEKAYVDFCGMIYNPNESLVAEFPKLLVTVKNGDGSIVATEEQVGSVIQPGDTITLCGMFSMNTTDLTEDTQIIFDVDWSELSGGTSLYSSARTTDFEITNVSERNGSDENFITGEITNHFTEDIDTVNLSLVLRKDGEIVFVENTFVDSIRAGQTKAFEFQRYHKWPEHDTIDVSAMTW